MLKVRDLPTLPNLVGAAVVAGAAGLDREVHSVNVMEVPDIEPYVQAGELLLTTAYPLRGRDNDLASLIGLLHRRRLAAMAVKTGRYLDQMPASALDEADRLGFPVLVLPDETSFNEVIRTVLAVVLAENGADAVRAETIRDRLTEVALAGGGLEEIAHTLALAVGVSVAVMDTEGQSLGASGQPLPQDVSGWWSFPITVANRVRGQLLVNGRGEPTVGQRRIIRQAAFAAGLHIAQTVAALELDRRMRRLFFEELVSGAAAGDAALRERAHLFGWKPGRAYAVALAEFSGETAALTSACVDQLTTGALVWERERQVVALIPIGPNSQRSVTDQLRGWQAALTRCSGATVRVAAGPAAAGAVDLARSHALAREFLQLAQAHSRTLVTYETAALERLLLTVPRPRLDAFVAEQIGPLQAADASGRRQLVQTLEAYVVSGSAAEAARRLYIHYNTMKYRLAQIGELLQVDLSDAEQRLALALAIKVMRQTVPRPTPTPGS